MQIKTKEFLTRKLMIVETIKIVFIRFLLVLDK